MNLITKHKQTSDREDRFMATKSKGQEGGGDKLGVWN